jgi:hypothetical protein
MLPQLNKLSFQHFASQSMIPGYVCHHMHIVRILSRGIIANK